MFNSILYFVVSSYLKPFVLKTETTVMTKGVQVVYRCLLVQVAATVKITLP